MNRSNLKSRWNLINPSVTSIGRYIGDVRQIGGKYNFLAILYKENRAGDNSEPIATFRNLNVFSRRRLRAPFHIVLRSRDESQPRSGKSFAAWNWELTPELLDDAMEFALATDFILTLSTVKSGASSPLNLHLQGLPSVLEWENQEYCLLESLLSSCPGEVIRREEPHICVLDYAVPAAKVVGTKVETCKKVLTMALGYDALQSFNLILTSCPEEEDDKIAAYFVPRRLDGQLIPSTGPLRRAFGSWEMAGTLLTADSNAFLNLNAKNVQEMLSEVTTMALTFS